MSMNGYILTNKNKSLYEKIYNKVMQLGSDYYKALGCDAVRIVNNNLLCFKCDTNKIIPMQLLDFSLQGLYSNEDMIDEIEKFGKYKCKVDNLSDINESDWNNGVVLL